MCSSVMKVVCSLDMDFTKLVLCSAVNSTEVIEMRCCQQILFPPTWVFTPRAPHVDDEVAAAACPFVVADAVLVSETIAKSSCNSHGCDREWP